MNRITADIVVEDPRWDALDLEALCEAACKGLGETLDLSDALELCVLATHDQKMTELNATFRGMDKATNVLSWPSGERGAMEAGGTPLPPEDPELGDIAIGFETCHAEAASSDIEVHDHVTHLVIHGILHLLGYDHERDEDATVMEGIEIEALERLGIANPY